MNQVVDKCQQVRERVAKVLIGVPADASVHETADALLSDRRLKIEIVYPPLRYRSFWCSYPLAGVYDTVTQSWIAKEMDGKNADRYADLLNAEDASL